MADDFKIQLPENIKLNRLTVVVDFSEYSPLIQRAVVLCLLHTDKGLTINGVSFLDLVSTLTTSSLTTVAKNLSPIADRVKELLNDTSVDVSDLTFELTQPTERTFRIMINILKTNGRSEQGGFTINE